MGSDRPLTPEETDAPADVGVREGGDADSVSDADEADDRPDMNGSTPGRDAPQVDRPGDVGVRDGALDVEDDRPDVVLNGPDKGAPSVTMPGDLPNVGDGASESDSPQDIGVRFGGSDGQNVTPEVPQDSVRDGVLGDSGAGGAEGESGSDDPSVRPNLGGVGSGIRIDPRLVKDAIKGAKDGDKS